MEPAATPALAVTEAAWEPDALEELVAPIALYPDLLVGQILASSVNAQEVLDAGNWLLENQDLKGEALDAAAQKVGFGEATRALVQFPTVIDMMCQEIDWTRQLGAAFTSDQKGVLEAVQRLRTQAVEVGNLKTSPQQTVERKSENGKTYRRGRTRGSQGRLRAAVRPYGHLHDPPPAAAPAAAAAPPPLTTTVVETTSGVSTGGTAGLRARHRDRGRDQQQLLSIRTGDTAPSHGPAAVLPAGVRLPARVRGRLSSRVRLPPAGYHNSYNRNTNVNINIQQLQQPLRQSAEPACEQQLAGIRRGSRQAGAGNRSTNAGSVPQDWNWTVQLRRRALGGATARDAPSASRGKDTPDRRTATLERTRSHRNRPPPSGSLDARRPRRARPQPNDRSGGGARPRRPHRGNQPAAMSVATRPHHRKQPRA